MLGPNAKQFCRQRTQTFALHMLFPLPGTCFLIHGDSVNVTWSEKCLPRRECLNVPSEHP